MREPLDKHAHVAAHNVQQSEVSEQALLVLSPNSFNYGLEREQLSVP